MANSRTFTYLYYVLLVVLILMNWATQSCEAFGTFGFDIHHRYSDQVKGILDLDGLPEKGTHGYYAAMAHRDRLVHGRRLAGSVNSSLLTFSGGNDTYRISSLGFLHYANVSVGTPSLSFLVALDTGSDLFWLPCDCTRCVHALKTRSGQMNLNIYSPNTSSTSTTVPCSSPMCQQQRRCSAPTNACPYQVVYLSNNTSSTGILVEDVLHLVTDDSQLKMVEAPIKFGCGKIQTGSFLDGAAPNGLFGLGMEDISVPSILASAGLAANSFSMCFGPDGIGRIRFGDEGSPDQDETPFNVEQSHPTYNISITQIRVGNNVSDLDFTAIFDSGTSFTYLNDPAYSEISKNFDSQALDKRHLSDPDLPFEYCYEIRGNETSVPIVNLTMKGGKQFAVTDPLVFATVQGGGDVYCLGVLKSGDVNIIGQNFMTGYHIVFDREKLVLGWKASDCYDAKETNTIPISPRNTTAPPPTINTVATSGNRTGSPLSSPVPPPPSGSHSAPMSSLACTLVMVLLSVFCHYMIIFSS